MTYTGQSSSVRAQVQRWRTSPRTPSNWNDSLPERTIRKQSAAVYRNCDRCYSPSATVTTHSGTARVGPTTGSGPMEKVKLSLDELSVESFEMAAEEVRGTVNANEFAPTARTFQCPCVEHTSPHECG